MPVMQRRHFVLSSLAFGAIASPLLGSAVEAVDLLRRGHAVIYFRHGATTWSGIDQIDWPRDRQRLLSERGIRQSEQIGAAFRSQGFPVGQILASPFARCRDMAEIAFGRVEESMDLLGLLSDDQGRDQRIAFLRDRLSAPTLVNGNRIIVSHLSNIAEVAGVSLDEGEAVIVRPLGESFERVAQLMPQDWASL